jgi:hypothetical protein
MSHARSDLNEMQDMAYIDLDNLRSVLLDDDALRVRKLKRRHCGSLRVTSGKIVACDPMVQPDRQAFVRQVPSPGTFPVDVLHDDSHALAVLWLRERALCAAADLHWEAALLADEAVDELKEDEFFGYPVDAGLGCFMDADAASAMAERDASRAADPHFNYYDGVLSGEMGSESIANHYPLGPDTRNNIVIFRSGWGDGAYPSYWALDANDEPVALVTDFMIIEGGDARTDEDRRNEAYLASLSPAKLAALEMLSEAVSRGEAEPIRALLANGLASPNEIVPSSGETAISNAIRLNKTEALRALLGHGSCPGMPERLHDSKSRTYLEYARRFKKPVDPALIALLEQSQAVPAGKAPHKPTGRSAMGFLKKWFS